VYILWVKHGGQGGGVPILRIDIRKLSLLVVMLAGLSAHPAGSRLGVLIDSVLHQGLNAQLPPHLALVLGIGTGVEPLAVKQAVLRDWPEVRVFNVSAPNHKDIVILRTNEKERTTMAYLVSTTGKLRKAVFFHAEEQARQIPAAEANAALRDEIKFWMGLGQPPARTP